jgi:hypothetical protein
VRRKYLLPLAFAALGLLGGSCSNNDQTMEPPGLAVSTRGNLRFKGPERLNADVAAALELSPDAVCTELGMYQCTALVHNVALGGVEPYGTGLYEPPGVTSATTPLVVERIAWAACTRRVDTDLANAATAVIYKGLPLNGARLANPDGDEVRGVITQLTQRALQRDPSETELARYTQLAKDIEATGNAEPARGWMQSVCFAVLSSAEAVFY